MIWEIFIKPAWYWIITIIPAVFGVLSVIKDFFPENIKNNYWLWLLHLLPKWAWLLITIIAFVITFVISAFRYFKDRENKASTTNITKVKSDGQSGGITAQQVIAESIFQGPVYIHTAQGNLQKNAKKNKRKTIWWDKNVAYLCAPKKKTGQLKSSLQSGFREEDYEKEF